MKKEQTVTLDDLLKFDDYKQGLQYLYDNIDLDLQVDDYKVDEDTNQERLEYIQETQDIKAKYGWDLSELWDFDTTLFRFMLPRLYVFYKTDDSLQQVLDDGTFGDILKAIIEGCLVALSRDDDGTYRDKIDKAMKLLGKYYGRLWN